MKGHRLVPSNLLRLILILVIGNAAVFFAAPLRPVHAATYSIACGDVSALISAINAANANPGADTISLAEGCTYTLTAAHNTGVHNASGLPAIASDITVEGSGATLQRSTAENTPDFRFFLVNAGGTLRLQHLTMMNGGTSTEIQMTPSTNEINGEADRVWGGAIQSFGDLFIQDCAFINNGSVYGGAILDWGHMTIESSLFTGNRAANGGAISHQLGASGDSLTITNSTFTGNAAGNSYIDGEGSAIISFGVLAITNSTIAGNNSIVVSPGQSGYAVYNNVGLTLANTILANNTASSNHAAYNCFRGNYVADSGGNVQWGWNNDGQIPDASCGDHVLFSDPLLGPLQDNGGKTQTMALLPTSPAIGRGTQANCPPVDQRGFERPAPDGPHCDSGAFETGASITGALAFQPAHLQGLGAATLTVTITGVDGGASASFTGLQFTGSLPDGLTIADPSGGSGNCAGSLTAAPGTQSFSLSGGSIPAGTPSCTVSFHVTPAASGEFTASIDPVTSKETGAGSQPAPASLIVTDYLVYLPMTIRP